MQKAQWFFQKTVSATILEFWDKKESMGFDSGSVIGCDKNTCVYACNIPHVHVALVHLHMAVRGAARVY